MKTRESGMPDEELWSTFFEPATILARLRLTAACRDVVEFGCGYGTFTVAAARVAQATIHAIDIDPQMVECTRQKAVEAGLSNIKVQMRDFVAEGTGLPDASTDYAMLFNILHAEQPLLLVREAWRVLQSGGILAIIHWNYDPTTPRGPSMEIRPRPEQCMEWARACGFVPLEPGIMDLPPYHYGMALVRPAGSYQPPNPQSR
jgi:ubiquinone/menaquinone biosynthesis C-methylase UbiE